MRIRSYARAFPSNRRIYRIDRWAVPVPGGLPLAATAWFIGLAIVMIASTQVGVVRSLAGVVGWPALILIVPGGGAVAMTRSAPDGRTLPSYLGSGCRWHLDRRRPVGGAEGLAARRLALAADHTLVGRVRVHGPGRIVTRSLALTQVAAGRALGIPSKHASAAVLTLDAGELVEVRA